MAVSDDTVIHIRNLASSFFLYAPVHPRYIHVDDLEWHQVTGDFWDFQGKQGRFPLNEPNGIWGDTIIHKPRVIW